MKSYSDLNESAQDVLCELGNIGTGNAVTALAGMIGSEIEMKIPSIRILGYNETPELLGGIEDIQVGILLDIKGDLNGMFMFLLNEQFTKTVLKALLGIEGGDITRLDEMGRSAICEIGNIMCCAYINALSKMMNIKVHVSVPDMCGDMVGAILSVPMIHFANLSDELLFIENQFNIGDADVVSHILFLPELESLEKMFQALGEEYEG